jgi:hypothetical protein
MENASSLSIFKFQALSNGIPKAQFGPHFYYTHFCPKYLEAQNDYPLRALGIHFLALFHTKENAWDSILCILPNL